MAAIEGYAASVARGSPLPMPQPNGDRVSIRSARVDGSTPVEVSRVANGKHVSLTYHPDGVRYNDDGEADSVASVTQWSVPQGEMGPANDYSQIGGSEYFSDLPSAVDKANEMLNTPVSGDEEVTPVVGGQSGPRMRLNQQRKLARPGWRRPR